MDLQNNEIISFDNVVARWRCSIPTVYRKMKSVGLDYTVVDGEKVYPLSKVIEIETLFPVRPYKFRKIETQKRRKYRKREKEIVEVVKYVDREVVRYNRHPYPPFLVRLIMLFIPTFGDFFVKE